MVYCKQKHARIRNYGISKIHSRALVPFTEVISWCVPSTAHKIEQQPRVSPTEGFMLLAAVHKG